MLSTDDFQQLQSENELLKIQLNDISEMINIREEEVDILRKKAANAILLQSTLEGNLNQIAQMQLIIGEQQKKAAGALRRETAMEEEVIRSIEMEKSYYTLQEKLDSNKAALKDLDNELAETASLYRQLSESMSRVAELESSLEMVQLENMRLKDMLERLTKQGQSNLPWLYLQLPLLNNGEWKAGFLSLQFTIIVNLKNNPVI